MIASPVVDTISSELWDFASLHLRTQKQHIIKSIENNLLQSAQPTSRSSRRSRRWTCRCPTWCPDTWRSPKCPRGCFASQGSGSSPNWHAPVHLCVGVSYLYFKSTVLSTKKNSEFNSELYKKDILKTFWKCECPNLMKQLILQD